MIGIVVVAHGNLADELIKSAKLFSENIALVDSISFLPGNSIDELYVNMKTAINNVDDGSGVMILTDLEGGSPSNEAGRLLMEGWRVEIVSGVNMPMLLTVLFEREEAVLTELAHKAALMAQKGIAPLNEKVMKRLRTQLEQADDMDERL